MFDQIVAQPVQGEEKIVLGALRQPLQSLLGLEKDHRLHIQDLLYTPDRILDVVLAEAVIEPQGVLQKVFSVIIHCFLECSGLWIQQHFGARDLHRSAGIDGDVAVDLQGKITADLVYEIGGIDVVFVGFDGYLPASAPDTQKFTSLHNGETAVAFDLDGLLVLYFRMLVIFHHLVSVFGRMGEKVFGPLEVLEHELIAVAAFFTGTGPDGAPGLVGGQLVGRQIFAVVDPAGNDGPIWIAVQEVDDYLLPHPGDMHGAPFAAGPVLGHPDPAGHIAIAFYVVAPVPEKLDLDPAVFVGMDLLGPGAGDDGRLAADDQGLAGPA